jgi:hypothetical protein
MCIFLEIWKYLIVPCTRTLKVKVKFVSTILNLAVDGGEWSASCASRSIPPGKEPTFLNGEQTGGSPSRSGNCGVEKNLFPLPGNEPWPSSPQPTLYIDWDIRSLHTYTVHNKITMFRRSGRRNLLFTSASVLSSNASLNRRQFSQFQFFFRVIWSGFMKSICSPNGFKSHTSSRTYHFSISIVIFFLFRFVFFFFLLP